MDQPSPPSPFWASTAVKVACGYLLFAGTWILCSDWLLAHWFSTLDELSYGQTAKGLLFVATTALLLFLYLSHCLRRQQQVYNELTTLFDAFGGIIYVADFDTYQLLYVNRFASERFGADWRGRNCFNYLQADQVAPCGFCTNPQLLKDGQPGESVSWEFRNTSDGRWYQCHDKAIRWSNGRLARMEIALDITERKELERTKDELLATVNHEMRTPLTAIAGFSELLGDDPTLPETTRQHLQIILRESEKLQKLIDSFMEVRRLKTDRTRIDYEPVDAGELLAQAIERHPDRASGHQLTVDCPAGLQVYGNRKELLQAFRQLVSNACRFSPNGGAVTLTASVDGEVAVFQVTDPGTAIPAEERERIFEPFHRLDIGDRRRSRGVGLGLTLAREILLLHGGTIRAEAAPTGGNRFVVTLPRTDRQPATPSQGPHGG